MNYVAAIVWGFGATTVLTTLLSGSRGLHMTRMDLPFMLGTMVTGDRDRAKWLGFVMHFVNGWIFTVIYVAAFASTGLCRWWFGMAIGGVHAGFVLVAGMTTIPAFHPRMAVETSGPDVTRQLEPPGFLAMNYGGGTPVATLIAHLVYGAILGAFAC